MAAHAIVAPVTAQPIAITGGTVFPGAGPKIERGTVVIVNGKITAVGPNVTVPAGATIVDATGKWVTPGLIHAGANAGTGVAGLGGYGERSVSGEVNPSFNLTDGIDPAAFSIAVARTGGVTTGVYTPDGSFIPGTAVVVDFAGETVGQMIVRSPAALLIDLSDGSKSAGGGPGLARLPDSSVCLPTPSSTTGAGSSTSDAPPRRSAPRLPSSRPCCRRSGAPCRS